MGIIYEEQRRSDSPFIERVWRSRSEGINQFTSIAVFQWDLVVWTHQGKTQAAIQGPETQASLAPVPEDAEFFGILFRPGVYMPHLPASQFINSSASLPDASSRTFWLKGDSWQYPTYDHAETFVERLLRRNVLAWEPVVDDVLRGCQPHMSLRSVQRRFLHTVGLTYRTMQQIERARRAALLLREGKPILDVAYGLGYFDHAHLTHSLRTFIGQTPSQLIDKGSAGELSLLYKTDTFC